MYRGLNTRQRPFQGATIQFVFPEDDDDSSDRLSKLVYHGSAHAEESIDAEKQAGVRAGRAARLVVGAVP